MNMKRFLFSLAVFVTATLTFAKVWNAETLPVPANTTDSTKVSYVSNPDGILKAGDVDAINRIMFQLEKNHGVRGLVICVEEIDPDDPYEFTIEVGNKHGIGGKSNTGFIIMIATVSRAWEVMPGDGMEKFLTDGECSSIGRIDMVPLMKEGKWGEAILTGLHKVQAVCDNEEELGPEYSEGADDDDTTGIFVMLGVLGGVAGLGIYAARQGKKCPKCQKSKYKLVLRQNVLAATEEGAPSDEQIDAQIIKALTDKKLEFKAEDVTMKGKEVVEDKELNEIVDKVEIPDTRLKKVKEDDDETLSPDNDGAKKKAKVSNYKKVRVIEIWRCSQCGYTKRVERKGDTNDYNLGLFTGGMFGAIAHASSSSSSGGYHGSGRSSGGGHSWGSSGGGHFGGGGAGGRF